MDNAEPGDGSSAPASRQSSRPPARTTLPAHAAPFVPSKYPSAGAAPFVPSAPMQPAAVAPNQTAELEGRMRRAFELADTSPVAQGYPLPAPARTTAVAAAGAYPGGLAPGSRAFVPSNVAPAPFVPAAAAPAAAPQPLTPQSASALAAQGNPYLPQGMTPAYGPGAEAGGRSGPGRTAPQALRAAPSLFMSEALRRDLAARVSTRREVLDPADPRTATTPATLRHYHSLVPLEAAQAGSDKRSGFSFASHVYKAQSSRDGKMYLIRRVDAFRHTDEYLHAVADVWRQHVNPTLVALHEIFVSKEFAEAGSTVFVHEYVPGAITLFDYLAQHRSRFLPESQLWSFAVQLVSCLAAVHAAGLACRTIHVTKVLLVGRGRLRIGAVGVLDAVDSGKAVAALQQEDLHSLGLLLLSAACRVADASGPAMHKSMMVVSQTYSHEFKNLLLYLLAKPNGPSFPNAPELVAMLASRAMLELNHNLGYSDALEHELCREVENGRMVRAMAKLNHILERSEHVGDPHWAETGDRYLIKLFRDYVYHQQREDGTPVLDLGHVTSCLNKLDAGSPERIGLISRDGETVLVVSYADLRRCVNNTFDELVQLGSEQL